MACAPLPRHYKSRGECLVPATKIQMTRIQETRDLEAPPPGKHMQLNAPGECETIYLVAYEPGSKETRAAIDRSASARERPPKSQEVRRGPSALIREPVANTHGTR